MGTNGEALQVLMQRVNNAGGTLFASHCKEKRKGLSSTAIIHDNTGQPICEITLNMKAPVQITLPDGTHVETLMDDGHSCLIGDAGDSFGNVETRVGLGEGCGASVAGMFCGQLLPSFHLKSNQKTLLKFKSPNNPWVCPFLIGTFCFGACCVNCIATGPSHRIFRDDQLVGDVLVNMGCMSWGSRNLPSWAFLRVQSSDPGVLRASINAIALYLFYGQFQSAAI
ncbi:hypothetical protein HOP50_13g68120 [Chloropicon primus]|uniref:Uncharacterized protein n=1 Tax=Chloropicon primus TaxID=1764295 RepID=A0A5B8MVJ4_9CHLO|nr:hypothetical protein A3770_13p67940 [Chloropicon primus]UPR03483.1 hypothetical protein HOP50_13g68120 [Chloropicon primus]|eukprot:QDZ24276.1 hypothetical protein A3770_13p67940 [Chloropicon primus]